MERCSPRQPIEWTVRDAIYTARWNQRQKYLRAASGLARAIQRWKLSALPLPDEASLDPRSERKNRFP